MAIPSRTPDSNAECSLPAVATAVAPTYTEGQAVPLSTDLNGSLRQTGGGGGGGGTEFNEDAAHSSGAAGTLSLGVRQDADTSPVSADGDYHANIYDSAGNLKVNVKAQAALPTGSNTIGAVNLAQYTPASGRLPVDGSGVTQPVSAASLPLPTGASTAAKQPALGTAGSASSDVITIQGIASMVAVKVDGSAVTQPVSGTVSITANSAVNVAQMNGVNTTMGNGASGTGVQRVTIASDSTGNIATIGTSVTPGTSAAHLGKAEDAAHSSGDTGVMALGVRAASPTDRSAGPTDGDYEPFGLNEVGAVWTTVTPSANGGCDISRIVSAASTNATSAKASAGTVYGWYISNANASARYFKLYNKASSPTVGTDTPVMTLMIPGGGAANLIGGVGIKFSTGIAYALTTGVADSDTGAVSANEHVVNLFYK